VAQTPICATFVSRLNSEQDAGFSNPATPLIPLGMLRFPCVSPRGVPLAWHFDKLRAAGFTCVDCFRRLDCDAIYGGLTPSK
jgi:hypothetical protein